VIDLVYLGTQGLKELMYTKILAERYGAATPNDEPEVPLRLRNPYGSTFLERLLLNYAVIPTRHPYNNVEKDPLFTPDILQQLERCKMMPEAEKSASIVRRDMRWRRC